MHVGGVSVLSSSGATCLFTGQTLDNQTRVEHTILSSLGGRIQSQIVSCSGFNQKCGELIDVVLADTYSDVFMALAPMLPSWSNPGKTVVWDESGNPFVIQDGVTSMEEIRVVARDARGIPTQAISSDIEGLKRWARKSLGKSGAQISIDENHPLPAEITYRRRPIVSKEAEVSALKCVLLTFDHLFADQPERRFTRFPELQHVRQKVNEFVMKGAAVDLEFLHTYILGVQPEAGRRFSELRARMLSLPVQAFEHILIASGNPPTRTLDVVWNVAGIEWLGFRLSSNWRGPYFTSVIVNQVLGDGVVAGPSWSVNSEALCQPSTFRSVPGPEVTAGNAEARVQAIPSALRRAAYQRAILHVEMNSDETVRRDLVRECIQGKTIGHCLQAAVPVHLSRFYSADVVSSTEFKAALEAFKLELQEFGNVHIRCLSDGDTVDWDRCASMYRGMLRRLISEFGELGHMFVHDSTIIPVPETPLQRLDGRMGQAMSSPQP